MQKHQAEGKALDKVDHSTSLNTVGKSRGHDTLLSIFQGDELICSEMIDIQGLKVDEYSI